MRKLLGLAALLLVVAAVGTGSLKAYRMVQAHNQKPSIGAYAQISPTIPIQASSTPDPTVSASPTPVPTPPSQLLLPVPYTDQAPLGNWRERQETCEEAALTMVVRYYQGDHDLRLDPAQADAQMEHLVGWQLQNWGAEHDLTQQKVGELAKGVYGYQYQVMPLDAGQLRVQIAQGHPILIGVRTHGLGNPNYPGYRDHFEQPLWSVPHFVVVVGYTEQGFILNDPGISGGQGVQISFDQLTHAVDDLDQHHPNLNEGRVMLLVQPAS